MTLIACGLNHKTAPIQLREQLAVTPEQHHLWLQGLRKETGIEEIAILSTCNRTEFYCDTPEAETLLPWIAEHKTLRLEDLAPHFYWHQDQEATRHAMRVACGLDSMMLGEPQILGQMKQAYHRACDAGTIGPELRNLFRHVFSASKRIRTSTGIGVNPVSVAFAAVDLMEQYLPELAQQRVMLIGAGETTQLVGKYLKEAGVHQFLVANRSTDHAADLAQRLEGQALGIGDIPNFLAQADIVVSATACPLPFITQNMVSRAMLERHQKPMFFVDLAVPRDIEPEVALVDQVYLYNVDDLQSVIEQGLSLRQDAAKQAEEIIKIETENYSRWQRALRAGQTIRVYRDNMKTVQKAELERAFKMLSNGIEPTQILEELAHRLVNKLIHQPSVKLRSAAEVQEDELFRVIDLLYLPQTSS